MLAFMAWPHDLSLFMPAPTRLAIPLVVRCGLSGAFGTERWAERDLRAASRFVAVSRGIGREIADALPGLDAPVTVIPNGADLDAFAAARPADLRLPQGSVVVGFVGRLHEEKGLLVPPGDARALAAALVRLASDPAERRRLGARAVEVVRERYAWPRVLDAYEAELKAAAGDGLREARR